MGTATRPEKFTRVTRARTSKVSPGVRHRPVPQHRPDLPAILCRFSDAIALLQVTQRSLVAQEIAGDEDVALRTGIAFLNSAYTELDVAIAALAQAVRT
jgi:hypothetical protein